MSAASVRFPSVSDAGSREAMKLIPAILSQNEEDFRRKVRLAESFADYVQIDFMDGRFVPSMSVPVSLIRKVAPLFRMEAHLMTERPRSCLGRLKHAGVEKIHFHVEAADNAKAVAERARSLGLKIGAALNPETPLSVVKKVVGQVDSVLFLTVHPGHYGHEFVPEVLGKLSAFKREYSHVPVGVDGGVRIEKLETVLAARPDFVTVGSAIFANPDPVRLYEKFARRIELSAA